jgi:hypothetical protein
MSWTRIRSYTTLAEATLTHRTLLGDGFEAEIRGEALLPLGGQIPFADARVGVWVPEAQADAAKASLAELDRVGEGPARRCPRCGEENPPAFDLCWACGSELATEFN